MKLASNPPPKGMKRSKGIVHHEPWSVSASQRVREFAGENLSVLSGKLFCNACWETLSVKKSVLNSVKHATGKECLASKQARERNLLICSGNTTKMSILLMKLFQNKLESIELM